jgi:hypothetical protein
MDRDSSAGIATGYGLKGWGSFPGRATILLPLHRAQTGSVAHPISYPANNGRVLVFGVKRSRGEAEN